MGYTNVFNFQNFKRLIKMYGKTNQEIAKEVKEFVYNQDDEDKYNNSYKSQPKFYGYYADYDWVVFCWLFGKMVDLPTGFPMYCIDLQQELDNKCKTFMPLNDLKKLKDYPKQTNVHNALSDARWNKELHNFLNIL